MTNVISSITGVFTAIAEWIANAVNAISPMFYSPESGLTFLGTLAVCGLGFGVVFLIIGLIQNFLHFRG